MVIKNSSLLGIPDDLLQNSGVDKELINYFHEKIEEIDNKTGIEEIKKIIETLIQLIKETQSEEFRKESSFSRNYSYKFNDTNKIDIGGTNQSINNIFILASLLVVQLRYLLTGQKPMLSVAEEIESNKGSQWQERLFSFEELLGKDGALKGKRIFLSQSYSQAVKLSSQISKIASEEQSKTVFNSSSINKLYSTLIKLATSLHDNDKRPFLSVNRRNDQAVYFYQKNEDDDELIFVRYSGGPAQKRNLYYFSGYDKYGNLIDVSNLTNNHYLSYGLNQFRALNLGGSNGWFYQYFQSLVKNRQFQILQQIAMEAEQGSLKTFLSQPTTKQDNVPASKAFDVTTKQQTISMKAGYKKNSMLWMTWNDVYKTLLEIQNLLNQSQLCNKDIAQGFSKIFVQDAKLNKDIKNFTEKKIEESINELLKDNS